MDNPINNMPRLSPPLLLGMHNQGEHPMETLTKRVEHLEKNTQKIQFDVALLTARSEHFATKSDIECLRTEQGQMRNELMGEMGQLERRIDRKFERLEAKFEKLNDRLTWSIMIPAILAVVAWFVKTAVMEI